MVMTTRRARLSIIFTPVTSDEDAVAGLGCAVNGALLLVCASDAAHGTAALREACEQIAAAGPQVHGDVLLLELRPNECPHTMAHLMGHIPRENAALVIGVDCHGRVSHTTNAADVATLIACMKASRRCDVELPPMRESFWSPLPSSSTNNNGVAVAVHCPSACPLCVEPWSALRSCTSSKQPHLLAPCNHVVCGECWFVLRGLNMCCPVCRGGVTQVRAADLVPSLPVGDSLGVNTNARFRRCLQSSRSNVAYAYEYRRPAAAREARGAGVARGARAETTAHDDNEAVVASLVLKKLTSKMKPQTRCLVVTTHALYLFNWFYTVPERRVSLVTVQSVLERDGVLFVHVDGERDAVCVLTLRNCTSCGRPDFVLETDRTSQALNYCS